MSDTALVRLIATQILLALVLALVSALVLMLALVLVLALTLLPRKRFRERSERSTHQDRG